VLVVTRVCDSVGDDEKFSMNRFFSRHFKDLHFLNSGWTLQFHNGHGRKSRGSVLKRFSWPLFFSCQIESS